MLEFDNSFSRVFRELRDLDDVEQISKITQKFINQSFFSIHIDFSSSTSSAITIVDLQEETEI